MNDLDLGSAPSVAIEEASGATGLSLENGFWDIDDAVTFDADGASADTDDDPADATADTVGGSEDVGGLASQGDDLAEMIAAASEAMREASGAMQQTGKPSSSATENSASNVGAVARDAIDAARGTIISAAGQPVLTAAASDEKPASLQAPSTANPIVAPSSNAAAALVVNDVENDDGQTGIQTNIEDAAFGTRSIPIDHYFVNQYGLLNTGQNGGTVGADINVTDVWDDYTGAGVNVGIIDDGIDYNHQDLDTNYNAALHANVSGTVIDGFHPDHDGRHGTAVAGIIGAERNGTNGTDGGTVGVAYGASLTSVAAIPARDPSGDGIVSPPIGIVDAVKNLERFDVVNNSWGFTTDATIAFVASRNNAGFDTFYNELDTQWVNGRGGDGTVFVKAAGNDRTSGGTSNQSGLNNHEDVVTVAALNNTGFVAAYSNGGSSVLVSGPAGPFAGDTWTTDRLVEGYDGVPGDGAFTDGFNGTSAASPFVSGVVALILEANPDLGYRDVAQILAYSSSHTGTAVGGTRSGSEQYDWVWNGADNWNGGGLHFSEDYGYGRVNAEAAVRLAESWTLTSNRANRQTTFEDDVNGTFAIPDNNPAGLTLNIGETTNISMEAVTVDISMSPSHTWVGDLQIILTSPEGTSVDLWTRNYASQDFPGRFTFGSQAFRGEESAGNWTIQFIDNAAGDTGSVDDVDLRTYGSAVTTDDLFVFTDEFSDYDGVGGHGTSFVGGAGTDTLNAAAVSSNTTINLGTSSGTIDGVAITASGIERVYTGDGNDTVVGGIGNEFISGGRGNDNLNGGVGTDTVNADAGDDTIMASGNFDTIDGGVGVDVFNLSTSTTGANWVNLDAAGSQFRVDTGAGYLGRATLQGIENVSDSSGADAFYGDADANTYFYSAGLDTFDGNGGIDTLDISAMTQGFQWINLEAPSSQLRSNDGSGWVANAILSDVERFVTTDDTDHVRGSSGEETFVYMGGRDFMDGRIGSDTIEMSEYDAGAWVNLNIAFDQFRFWNGVGYESGGNMQNIENMIGGDGNDFYYADAADNRFFGGLGNDRFEAAGGANDIFAEDGNLEDYALSQSGGTYTMTGISGTDTLIGVEFIDLGGTTYGIAALDWLI